MHMPVDSFFTYTAVHQSQMVGIGWFHLARDKLDCPAHRARYINCTLNVNEISGTNPVETVTKLKP
jgi:hypothetical protein